MSGCLHVNIFHMFNDDNFLKHESLRASGYAGLVASAALFASGMMSGRKQEAITGVVYSAANLVFIRYGKEDAERRLHTLDGSLKEYFIKQHIPIPKDSELNSAKLKDEGSIIDRIEDFMYEYPTQIVNTMNAVGGFAFIRSGMKHGNKWDAASGALVTAGSLAGILIPEKYPDPDHPPTSGFGKAWEWVQEKPLRTSGYLFLANNPTLLMSALQERKTNPQQKSYLFKLLATASYMVANGLLAISSKDSTSYIDEAGSAKSIKELETTAAKVIAAQPEELQSHILEQTAGFLAAKPDIKLSATQIASDLAERIKELSTTQTRNWQENIQQQRQNNSPSVVY